MKRILIPTDFSVPAENAARYAVALAKKIKADILLCYAFKVPAQAPMAAQVAWPLMDYGELKQEATDDLDACVKLLSDESCSVDEGGYCPNLTYESSIGTVSEVVTSIVRREKIDLIVMGMAGAGGLTQFILGSNSRVMIDKTPIPLLLVPFEAELKSIRKIAFATDLELSDISALQFLANLALQLSATLTVVHVTNKEVDPKGNIQEKIDVFFNSVALNVKFNSIKYEYVWNIHIDDGLNWIAEQEDLDMMAISHDRHSLLGKIFKGSHTHKLSRHTKIPLLVFPKHARMKS